MDERPLDFLNSQKGKKVLVFLKDVIIEGKLISFDIHINVVLENAKEIYHESVGKNKTIVGDSFVKGENIIRISKGGN